MVMVNYLPNKTCIPLRQRLLWRNYLPNICQSLAFSTAKRMCAVWIGWGGDCRAMGDWGNAGSKASKGKCGNKKFLIGVYIIQRFYNLYI